MIISNVCMKKDTEHDMICYTQAATEVHLTVLRSANSCVYVGAVYLCLLSAKIYSLKIIYGLHLQKASFNLLWNKIKAQLYLSDRRALPFTIINIITSYHYYWFVLLCFFRYIDNK